MENSIDSFVCILEDYNLYIPFEAVFCTRMYGAGICT
jgi:hypothetical protein